MLKYACMTFFVLFCFILQTRYIHTDISPYFAFPQQLSGAAAVTWLHLYKHWVTSCVYSLRGSSAESSCKPFPKWPQTWKDLFLSRKHITINMTITIWMSTLATLVAKGDPRGKSSWTQIAIVPLDTRGRSQKNTTTAKWNAEEPRARRLECLSSMFTGTSARFYSENAV